MKGGKHYVCIPLRKKRVAQLVERNLAKVEVASSNLVFRSKINLVVISPLMTILF